jgi:hypothetical protein
MTDTDTHSETQPDESFAVPGTEFTITAEPDGIIVVSPDGTRFLSQEDLRALAQSDEPITIR